jgi:hypothetical protein
MSNVVELESPIRETISVDSPISETTVDLKSAMIDFISLESSLSADVYSRRV